MKNQKGKLDKVSCSILAAFVLMSSTHFACRYDVASMVDEMFQKVSAETVVPNPVAPDPIAAPPALAPTNAAEAANVEAINQPTITRNPFLVPAVARAATTPVTPPTNDKIWNSGKANSAGVIPAQAAPAPVVESRPIVRGVVESGGKRMAIIEYKGSSNTYSAGQSVGGHSVGSIGNGSVAIDGHTVAVGGKG